MNSATSRFWGRAHNDAVEGDRRALVIGSGYASTKHAEARRNLLAAVYARLPGDGQPSAAALDNTSRERWVSV